MRRGRGKVKRTTAQDQALAYVTETREAYLRAAATLKARALAKVAEELRSYEEAMEKAVYDGFREGIPKSHLYQEGWGVSTPNQVLDIIKRYQERELDLSVELPQPVVKPQYRFASITGSSRDAVYAVVQTGDDETWTHDVMGEVTGYLLGFAENSDSELELALNPIAHRAPTDVTDWAKANIEKAWNEREAGE